MKNIKLNIATSWNQLTRKQILFVSKLYLSKLDLETFRIKAFLFLTGIKALPKKVVKDQVYWIFKRGNDKFMLDRQELAWFLHSVDYLTGDCKLTNNLFPSFSLFLTRYFGPSRRCYNLSYLEFIHAEKCLYAFQKTNESKHLNDLCSVLYRPGKKNYHPLRPDHDGDRREKFNDYVYSKRSVLFRMLSIEKRFAVYLFYTGSRNFLIESFPNLFKSGTISSEPVNPVDSLRNIIHDLNGGDPTRNDKLYQMQVWEAFEHLDHLIKTMPKKKKNGNL